MTHLTLVKARKEDCNLLFDWANEESVRENSFDSSKIIYEDHYEWFIKKLKSPDTLIYIVKNGNQSIGVIRLEKRDNDSLLINYSVDVKYRRQGYGTKFLILMKENFSNKTLIGKVKNNNMSSIRAFEKAGYIKTDKPAYIEFSSKKVLRWRNEVNR